MNSDRKIVTISKEKLAELPAAEYKGRIVIVDKEEKVAAAIRELRKHRVIGFDTETRPSFRKGQSYNVALIQLSSPDCCYLFRTNIIGFPKELFELFEDSSVIKVGLSVHDDFHQLNKISAFSPASFIELQNFVKDYMIADNSLSRIYGILFGQRVSKGQRLTNWEAEELTQPQMAYAALDAHACIEIYDHLKSGKFKPKQSPYLTALPDPEEPEEVQSES